jgi:beta-glucosidase
MAGLSPAAVAAIAFSVQSLAAPSPAGSGVGSDLDRRVETMLAAMSLEEKIDTLGGVDGFFIRANPRIGLPAIRMADGPFGVGKLGPATAYAAGIALAASWDPALARRVGALIGRDARARGVRIMLAPGVNIYRAPLCGRNFEYFGEDPFLASRIAVGYIEGMQAEGVSATVKHFLANDSEADRHHTSSELDERTMREIYLPPFEAAVKEARVGAVMTSYNLVNGVHMTENGDLIGRLLKREWGFDGIVMSDWDATYDGVTAANAGLDLEMPAGKFMNRATLLPAIRAGQISVATIDDKVRRILRTAARFGWLDQPAVDAGWPLYSEAGRLAALDAARAGIVLLKNDRLLPFDPKKIKTLAVIGPDAYPAVPMGGGSAQVRPFAATSYVQGLARRLPNATVTYNRGVATFADIFDSTEFLTAAANGKPGLVGEYFDRASLAGAPTLTRVDEHVDFAWDKPNAWPTGQRKQSAARWSGVFVPPVTSDYWIVAWSYGLDEYRLYVDGKLILDRAGAPQPFGTAKLPLSAGRPYAIRFEYLHGDHHARVGLGVRRADAIVDPAAQALAARADAAVVFAGFDPWTESEGYDRTFALPLGQDQLISDVRAANKNTVVAITSGGGVDMRGFVESARGIIQTWYAGEEAGTALAEILMGDVNPSGKLPVSFERRFEDNAVSAHGSYAAGPDHEIRYREGVFVGYRHFDETGTKPLFPFGHGLSYTSFTYARLTLSPRTVSGADGSVTVSFVVRNVGKRAGAEVAEVYVADPHPALPRPPKELKGFVRVALSPGQERRVSVRLDRRAFSFFDVGRKAWVAAAHRYTVLVGPSAGEIALRGNIELR